MKKALVTLIVSSSLCVLFAQNTGKISGVITDPDGNPLAGANIIIKGTTYGAAADVEGYYAMLNVPVGTYDVSATYVGYGTLTKTGIRVNLGQSTPQDFQLAVEAVEGQEVVVVGDRPPVEVDMTYSSQRISADEIAASWAQNVTDIVQMQSGTNIHGGIRGGFGMEDLLRIDGMGLRDRVGGTNFNSINTTTISELEILNGGWNAEYGNASGSIINVITKSASDRIHASARYRTRPSGKYHWGRNIYSKDNFEYKVMTTEAYWDPTKTYTDFGGNEKPGSDGGGNWSDKTPAERAAAWKNFVSGELIGNSFTHMLNYEDKTSTEVEATVYGPIGDKMNFLLSLRNNELAPRFPGLLEFSTDYSYQANFKYRLSKATSFEFQVMSQGYENTGRQKSMYWSSEDSYTAGFWVPPPYVNLAYNPYKYWPFGTGHLFQLHNAPEYSAMTGTQFKVTHMFSEKAFVNVALDVQSMDFNRDNKELVKGSDYYSGNIDDAFGSQWADADFPSSPLFFLPPIFHRNRPQIFMMDVTSGATTLDLTYTNQINRRNQVKAGFMYSTQKVRKEWTAGDIPGAFYNNRVDVDDQDHKPWEMSFFAQDKFEAKGMVINIGFRYDAYNLNKIVPDDIWDPYRYDINNPDNLGVGVYSYDPAKHGVKTSTMAAFSPRIGISHPITDNSVIHFSYGHFNQRPPWQLMAGRMTNFSIVGATENPVTGTPNRGDMEGATNSCYMSNTFSANPALDFEKIIQYEVGFDQHIPGVGNIDLTMYIKDGRNLTSLGVSRGKRDFSGWGDVTNEFGGELGAVYSILFPDQNAPYGFVGPNMGRSRVTMNGGNVDIRGMEASFETAMSNFWSVKVAYNYSILLSGQTGIQEGYRPKADGTQFAENLYHGANLNDRGLSGAESDRWNPANTFKINAHFGTPSSMGLLLGGWNANLFYTWAQGHKYTYHPPGDTDNTPLNKSWVPYKNMNGRFSKKLAVGGTNMTLAVDVINLLNKNRVRFPTGGAAWSTFPAIEAYEKDGTLSVNAGTGEDDVWNWYTQEQFPRELWFSLQVDL